jgi:exopolysaccharide biosynthesis polyprenyl glycosylphosphotransferase
MFDIVFSSMLLILFSPIVLLISLLIKLNSKGSIFYSQDRVGLDGNSFNVYKFRTMKTDAEKHTGPVWASQDDPRVTKVGKFLRRTSLDEIPQFINVLRGDMSVVGPRPERPHFVNQFKDVVPKYLDRHLLKTGITGWAQVNGLRGQAPIEERTKYDLYYIENWSLAFDIKIILKTIYSVMFGKDAY